MKIRSITVFLNPGLPPDPNLLARMSDFRQAAAGALEDAGYDVQTCRLAAPPFPTLLSKGFAVSDLRVYAKELEAAAAQAGFAYLSLGPAMPAALASYEAIPEAIAGTENVFFSGSMTDDEGRVSLAAVRACARVIQSCAPLSPDGFANLRFAALANVPPGTPFFPAAYHIADSDERLVGDFAAFAVATEAADLAVDAFSNAGSLNEARQRLVEAIETHAGILERTAGSLANQFGVGFNGIDFSLAPFPERVRSLGEAIERLGVPSVGQPGSLAASAILAEAIDRARFARVGFNGLFLPVLEDAVLAERASEGGLSVRDLLMYSAVCGTGLDTIPLPGDVSLDAIHALLLDVAVLSSRLAKPLTARLMPIPDKKAGDPTGFDFAFFANSRVMALDTTGPLGDLFQGDDSIMIRSRMV